MFDAEYARRAVGPALYGRFGIALESAGICAVVLRTAFGRRRIAFRRRLSAVSILLSYRRVLCMQNARQMRYFAHSACIVFSQVLAFRLESQMFPVYVYLNFNRSNALNATHLSSRLW